jgi:hypothetical protein
MTRKENRRDKEMTGISGRIDVKRDDSGFKGRGDAQSSCPNVEVKRLPDDESADL